MPLSCLDAPLSQRELHKDGGGSGGGEWRGEEGARCPGELELELIPSHMAQKPMLRGKVGCDTSSGKSIEALCAAPPEALAHSPSQMPLSCLDAPLS